MLESLKDPKVLFSLLAALLVFTVQDQDDIKAIFGEKATIVTHVCGYLAGLIMAGYAVLHGASVQPAATPPAEAPHPEAAKVAGMLAWLLLPLVLVALLASPALAQDRNGGAPRGQPNPNIGAKIIDDINAARARGIASGNDVKLTGDPVADLHAAIQKGGQKLIMHLKQSYALAVAKATNGQAADNTSATCTKALVPIVSLVVNGPPSGTLDAADPMNLTADEQHMAADGTEEGVIVKVEKLRILRLALNSPALNDACGALVQDEVRNAQGLIGKITSLITGAGLAGIPLGIP